MNGKDAAPISAPLYRASAEITPDEYEYYMRKAQQMRAESAAEWFRTLGRAITRLFVTLASRAYGRSAASPKARPTAERQRRAPVFAKSRTA